MCFADANLPPGIKSRQDFFSPRLLGADLAGELRGEGGELFLELGELLGSPVDHQQEVDLHLRAEQTHRRLQGDAARKTQKYSVG